MSQLHPTLKEIVQAVAGLIELKLEPIRADIRDIKSKMVTKADIAPLKLSLRSVRLSERNQ